MSTMSRTSKKVPTEERPHYSYKMKQLFDGTSILSYMKIRKLGSEKANVDVKTSVAYDAQKHLADDLKFNVGRIDSNSKASFGEE